MKEPGSQWDLGRVFRYDDVCEQLRRYSISIEQDLKQLLALMLFNRAIHNTDDHERNFSLINRGAGYQLAPAYDLVPSVVTGEYHAAGFQLNPDPPKPSEASKLGKIFGLPKTSVADIAERVIDAVSRWESFAEQSGVNQDDVVRIKPIKDFFPFLSESDVLRIRNKEMRGATPS
ncbi:MAG: HipA domain-containing protein [Proteobacteria bacterium]|nr:HipA domain-containing protein [Pseudomonadota bacterium]